MNTKRMRGVYVVEFAILGLLLFILLFGMLEVGRLLFTVNTLNESVRRGARLAAVCQIHDPLILRRAVLPTLERYRFHHREPRYCRSGPELSGC